MLLLGGSPNLNNNRKISQYLPHNATCLTQQNLHANYWVGLCEEGRKTPPPRGTTISKRGQKVLCGLPCHLFLILMGHPCHCLQEAFQILLHTSHIASPSWWKVSKEQRVQLYRKTPRASATEMPSSFFSPASQTVI